MYSAEPDARHRQMMDEVAACLSPELRLLVVTGAGMSAESGLPTYRGTGGLYNSGRTEQGMSIEQVLSAGTFRRNPALTWKYLGEIGRACEGKSFNQGHRILAEMESSFADLCILTQNIDGFHVDAGSRNVIEIHGNLHRLRCEACEFRKTVQAFSDIPIPPVCESCQRWLRPDVVLFDEMLPVAACEHLSRQWRQGFDVVFSIGTSSNFPYIAEPVLRGAAMGCPVIEINLDRTPVSDACSFNFRLPASQVLEGIWSRFQSAR